MKCNVTVTVTLSFSFSVNHRLYSYMSVFTNVLRPVHMHHMADTRQTNQLSFYVKGHWVTKVYSCIGKVFPTVKAIVFWANSIHFIWTTWKKEEESDLASLLAYTQNIIYKNRRVVLTHYGLISQLHFIVIYASTPSNYGMCAVCNLSLNYYITFFFYTTSGPTTDIPSRKEVGHSIGITDNAAVHQCVHYIESDLYMHYSIYCRAYGPS